MDLMKMAFSALLTCALVMTGCGDDDGTTEDGGTADSATDAPASEPLAGCEDGTCAFLMSNLTIPNTAMPTMVAGYDIDGMNSMAASTSCDDVEDFSNGARVGIDNGFASFATSVGAVFDLNTPLAEAFTNGDLVLIFELTGVDGATDSDVTVDVFVLDAGATGGNYDAGQEIAITGSAVASFSAALADGKLTGEASSLAININVMGSDIALTIQDAQFEADVSASGFANATLGGALNVDALVTTICAIDNEQINGLCGDDGGQVRQFLSNAADLTPNGDGTVCADLSIGLPLTAVPATRAGS